MTPGPLPRSQLDRWAKVHSKGRSQIYLQQGWMKPSPKYLPETKSSKDKAHITAAKLWKDKSLHDERPSNATDHRIG